MKDGTMAGPEGPTTQRGDRVAGVVLAAGASTRMGANKLLLELAGQPLARRAAARALAAGLSPVVVVVGHEAARVEAALAGLGCLVVRNPDHALGQGSSLRAGLQALPPDVAAAVVSLADMPLVTPALLASLVAGWRASGAPLVLAAYADVLAPPALYARALFDELGGAGEAPGKRVVARHRAEALTIPFPPEVLADVDRPGDLEKLIPAPRSPA